jgi:hypothetical protein
LPAHMAAPVGPAGGSMRQQQVQVRQVSYCTGCSAIDRMA